MKKNILWIMIGLFAGCTSTQPLIESTRAFTQETKLSVVVPMRFYTWVKVDNADRVLPDILNGLLDFEYDSSGDFLLKTITQDDRIVSVWGSQIRIQNEDFRQLVFSPFVAAVYALEDGSDPLDVAFEALKQILSDRTYAVYEKELVYIFQEGIRLYRAGGTAWADFKAEHFIVVDKTIIIQ